jgi:hypothetical protein
MFHVQRPVLSRSSCVWLPVFHVERSGPRADYAKSWQYLFVWAISISRTYPILGRPGTIGPWSPGPRFIPIQSDVLQKSRHETLPDRRTPEY